MIPASTNGLPLGAIAAATRSTVCGLMALQSTYTGLALLAVSAGTKRCASATASPGGRIDRMNSAAAISSSLAAIMPAALARATVPWLRARKRRQNLDAVIGEPFSDRGPHHAGSDHRDNRRHVVLDLSVPNLKFAASV